MPAATWDSATKAAGITLGSPFPAQSNSGSWTSGTTFSWTQFVGGSNTLVIAAISLYSTAGARTVSTATCGGSAMTVLDTISASLEGNTQRFEIWYFAGAATGNNTISVTLSASTAFIQAQSMSFAGIDQVTPIDSHAISQNTSAATSASLATTVVASNSILGGFIYARIPSTISAGAGTTVIQNAASGQTQATAWSGGTVGTGSQSLAYTFTSSTVPGIATFSLKNSGSYLFNVTALTVSGTNPGVFCTRTISSPLTYWEIAATTLTTTFAIGFANRSWNDASNTILGGDANGLGFEHGGLVKLNNATLATIFTYTQGDVIQVAVRAADRTVFFRLNNAGNWNNVGGTDPVTNTGGIDYSSMSFGTLLPAFGAATTQVATAHFSTADFTYTAPTGFVTIDTTGASGISAGLANQANRLDGPIRQNPTTETNQLSPGVIGSAYGNYSGSTNISGNVKELGVNAPGKKVILIDRNGHFVGYATTDGSGNYTIKGRGRNSTVAIALDDPNFNALVYDVVVPV